MPEPRVDGSRTIEAASLATGSGGTFAVGVTHFVLDTSRNGLGPAPDGAWCNPPGRALGTPPGESTEHRLDWTLGVKRPGESDGTCNGGPAAGAFWPEYALGLASRATGQRRAILVPPRRRSSAGRALHS